MTGLPTTISRCLVDDGCRQQQCSAGGVSRSSGRYTQVKLRRVLRDAADYIGSCTYVNTSLICTTTSLRHEIKPLIRYLSPDWSGESVDSGVAILFWPDASTRAHLFPPSKLLRSWWRRSAHNHTEVQKEKYKSTQTDYRCMGSTYTRSPNFENYIEGL